MILRDSAPSLMEEEEAEEERKRVEVEKSWSEEEVVKN